MNNGIVEYAQSKLSQPIARYFVMAGFVVVIELATFVFMNSVLGISYLIATPISNIIAIILNWYFSVKFVFSGRRHKIHVEGGLIIFASVVGLLIQIAVTAFCVQILNLVPFAGKVLAIVASFFWSYWVRKKYIFTV